MRLLRCKWFIWFVIITCLISQKVIFGEQGGSRDLRKVEYFYDDEDIRNKHYRLLQDTRIMKQQLQQRLFWSVSRPLKYLGLTIDEWLVTMLGVIPGFVFLNSGDISLGFSLFVAGIFLCMIFKKYKRLSSSFKLKSFLIAHGILKAPASYPRLLKKHRVGR